MRLFRPSRWFAAAVVVPAIGVLQFAPARDAEVHRIRAHFDSVLTELGSRDVTGLTSVQRVHRAAIVAEVASYRDRGVFPHNYDFPGQAIPYFVDRETGTLCAVANLLDRTGRRDVVDRVARGNNNLWVSELAGDTAFTAWLDDNGLTLAEAARIQVPYVKPVSNAEVARDITFGLTAPIALVTAGVTSMWNATGNADGHASWGSWTGMISGAAAVTAGAMLQKGEFRDALGGVGLASAGMGALSMAISAHSMHRHGQVLAAEREAATKSSVAEATISPIVTANGKVGIGGTLRF